MAGIFISYRGDDSQLTGALIFNALADAFGEENVFLDSRSIRAGDDFGEVLLGRLRTSVAVLAVIGPRWLDQVDENGRPRIHQEDDWVRRELAEAFRLKIRVIPVLIDGARLPDESDLPRDIAEINRHQSLYLRRRYSAEDLASLVARLGDIDASLVAGDRNGRSTASGQVHSASGDGAQIGGPPRQLPATTPAFTGRSDELRQLAELADAASRGTEQGAVVISAIDGMGGIGKTSLAVRAAHRMAADFPDGHLFLDLHGYNDGIDPATSTAALEALLRSLSVPPWEIPADMEQRAALYRSRLAGTRTLILLDNAFSTAQVKPLLPGTPGSLVMITSRRRLVGLDDAQPLPLAVLPEADAIELFHKIAGAGRVSADDPVISDIIELCGRLPLAIRIVAARMRHHQALRLDHVADQLRDEQHRLNHLQDDERNLTAVLRASYRHVPAAEAHLFRDLGIIPGPDVDAYAVANLIGTDHPTAETLLDSLLDQNLLVQRVAGRYRFHDLVRVYAKTLMPGTPQDRAAAADRLLDYYLATAQAADSCLERSTPRLIEPMSVTPAGPIPDVSIPTKAEGWIGTELANITAAAEYAVTHERPGHAIALSAALAQFLRLRGPWTHAADLHRASADTAARTGDRLGQALALINLSDAQRLLGRFAEAEAAMEEPLEIFRSLHHPLGQAVVLNALGSMQYLSGPFARAEDTLTTALDLYRGIDEPLGEAGVLIAMADIYWITGAYARAESVLNEALALHDALGNRFGKAVALIKLGGVERVQARYIQAEATLAQALEHFRALDDHHGTADALTEIGVIQRDIGAYFEAQASLGEAHDLNRALGNRLGQANALFYLGSLHRLIGATDRAQEFLYRALEIYRAHGNGNGEATVHMQLGALQRDTGALDRAAGTLAEALHMYRELGIPGGEVETLNYLAMVASALGKPQRARALHTDALTLARSIPSPWDEANALDGIGTTYQSEGDRAHAETCFREALALYRSMGCVVDVSRVQAALENLGRPGQEVSALNER